MSGMINSAAVRAGGGGLGRRPAPIFPFLLLEGVQVHAGALVWRKRLQVSLNVLPDPFSEDFSFGLTRGGTRANKNRMLRGVKLVAQPVGKEAGALPMTKDETRLTMDGLLLKNEAGLRRRNPPWKLVEKVVREIDTGHGNSFCILEASDDHYIQALHGFNGYHLEWRTPTTSNEEGYIHYRACYPGGSPKIIELKKHDYTNNGEHRDLLLLEDVIDGFRFFYRGEPIPGWLEWRVLEI